MITLRRAEERRHERRRKHETWLTFCPQNGAEPLGDGFGALEILNEVRLAPGAGIPPYANRATEIVTYVLDGTLAHEDSKGRSSVIRAGEFHRMSSARAVRHSEVNASRLDWVHLFQMGLYSSDARLGPSHEQKRFSAAQRRGILCTVASPGGRKGSLSMQQDVAVYSAIMDPGQHLVHELSQGRSAWLHVIRGEATLGGVVLTTGDGASIAAERAVSVTARSETEILLLDVRERLPRALEAVSVPKQRARAARV